MSEVAKFRLSGNASVINVQTGHNATLRSGLVVLSEDGHGHAIEALRAESERLEAQRDAILQQARNWACEAKTQRSTVDAVGEILGGIPDWGPITAGVEAMRAELAALRQPVADERCEKLRAIHSMILNALDRDAAEGKQARGEMAAELRAALSAPAAGQLPVAWKVTNQITGDELLCNYKPGGLNYVYQPLYAAPITPNAAGQDVSALVEALEHARQFIRNGVELGYIQMPDVDTPDPAHDTLPKIDTALAAHKPGGGA